MYPDREQIHPEMLTMGVAEQKPRPKEPFNMGETFDVVWWVDLCTVTALQAVEKGAGGRRQSTSVCTPESPE